MWVKWNGMLEMLLERSTIPRNRHKIIVDPIKLRPTDITLQIPDCTKFMTTTGWKPFKTIENIIDDILMYWRGNVLW